jgi:hypothetical protein
VRHNHQSVADSQSVAWAVALGCTTAVRLAREWGIRQGAARDLLVSACNRGMIARIGKNRYANTVACASGEATLADMFTLDAQPLRT